MQRPGGKKRQPGATEDLKECQEGWGPGMERQQCWGRRERQGVWGRQEGWGWGREELSHIDQAGGQGLDWGQMLGGGGCVGGTQHLGAAWFGTPDAESSSRKVLSFPCTN